MQNPWDDLVPGDIIEVGTEGWLALYVSRFEEKEHKVFLMWQGRWSLITLSEYGTVLKGKIHD